MRGPSYTVNLTGCLSEQPYSPLGMGKRMKAHQKWLPFDFNGLDWSQGLNELYKMKFKNSMLQTLHWCLMHFFYDATNYYWIYMVPSNQLHQKKIFHTKLNHSRNDFKLIHVNDIRWQSWRFLARLFRLRMGPCCKFPKYKYLQQTNGDCCSNSAHVK